MGNVFNGYRLIDSRVAPGSCTVKIRGITSVHLSAWRNIDCHTVAARGMIGMSGNEDLGRHTSVISGKPLHVVPQAPAWNTSRMPDCESCVAPWVIFVSRKAPSVPAIQTNIPASTWCLPHHTRVIMRGITVQHAHNMTGADVGLYPLEELCA